MRSAIYAGSGAFDSAESACEPAPLASRAQAQPAEPVLVAARRGGTSSPETRSTPPPAPDRSAAPSPLAAQRRQQHDREALTPPRWCARPSGRWPRLSESGRRDRRHARAPAAVGVSPCRLLRRRRCVLRCARRQARSTARRPGAQAAAASKVRARVSSATCARAAGC